MDLLIKTSNIGKDVWNIKTNDTRKTIKQNKQTKKTSPLKPLNKQTKTTKQMSPVKQPNTFTSHISIPPYKGKPTH